MPATHVITLIADGAVTVLSPTLADRLAATVEPSATVWLDEGKAIDFLFDFAPHRQAAALRLQPEARPLDMIVQPIKGRRKRLFLADMDSTMIEQECIDELADFVAIKSLVADITARAMRGELAFEPALKERVSLLKGLPTSIVDQVIAERITLRRGARTLVATMRAHGTHTLLVSGGFTLFTQVIAKMIGFDDHRANVLGTEAGKLSGWVEEPILGREGKLDCLKEFSALLQLEPHETLAVGDGANDVAMLQAAGLGVAFHAKPAVVAQISARIDHADLTALLYAQGYRGQQFQPGAGP
jgi:phosphoserine phosphatase